MRRGGARACHSRGGDAAGQAQGVDGRRRRRRRRRQQGAEEGGGRLAGAGGVGARERRRRRRERVGPLERSRGAERRRRRRWRRRGRAPRGVGVGSAVAGAAPGRGGRGRRRGRRGHGRRGGRGAQVLRGDELLGPRVLEGARRLRSGRGAGGERAHGRGGRRGGGARLLVPARAVLQELQRQRVPVGRERGQLAERGPAAPHRCASARGGDPGGMGPGTGLSLVRSQLFEEVKRKHDLRYFCQI